MELQRELVFLHAPDFSRFENITQALELLSEDKQKDKIRPNLIRIFQHHPVRIRACPPVHGHQAQQVSGS
ncbi:hypothetical protein [Salmonella enterica]|uniref:hypothetical protein n=1 Tax=Salmonella enterica TaxID=28901 RepID=UPI001482D843